MDRLESFLRGHVPRGVFKYLVQQFEFSRVEITSRHDMTRLLFTTISHTFRLLLSPYITAQANGTECSTLFRIEFDGKQKLEPRRRTSTLLVNGNSSKDKPSYVERTSCLQKPLHSRPPCF